MSTPLDLLRVGQFVCVIDERPGPYAPSYTLGRRPAFDGVPYEVRSIALPWVCLSDGRGRFAVDCRAYELQVMPAEYVRAMLNSLPLLNVSLPKTRIPTPEQQTMLNGAVEHCFRHF